MLKWAGEYKVNCKKEVCHVQTMSTSIGAGTTLLGALSTGSQVSVICSSKSILQMLPNMHYLAAKGESCVFHVAASAVNDDLTVCADYTDVLTASPTGCALLHSTSVQEVHDMAILSHIASARARMPFVHFYDGTRTAHEVTNSRLLEYSSLSSMSSDSHRYQSFQRHQAVADTVDSLMDEMASKLNRRYFPFEYTGSPRAEVVVVALCSADEHSALENAVAQWCLKKGPVGLLTVRLVRPWSPKHFLRALPLSSAKRCAVVHTGKDTSLYADVSASIYSVNRFCQVVDVEFEGQSFFSPSMEPAPVVSVSTAADALLQRLTARDMPPKSIDLCSLLKTYNSPSLQDPSLGVSRGSRSNSLYMTQGTSHNIKFIKGFHGVKVLVWDAANALSMDSIKALGDDFIFLHAMRTNDAYSAGGATSCTQLQLSSSAAKRMHDAEGDVDIVVISAASKVLLNYDAVAQLKPGGVLLLNTSIDTAEALALDDFLPPQFRLAIAENKYQLFVVDAEGIQEEGIARVDIAVQFALSRLIPQRFRVPPSSLASHYNMSHGDVQDIKAAVGLRVKKLELPAEWLDIEIEYISPLSSPSESQADLTDLVASDLSANLHLQLDVRSESRTNSITSETLSLASIDERTESESQADANSDAASTTSSTSLAVVPLPARIRRPSYIRPSRATAVAEEKTKVESWHKAAWRVMFPGACKVENTQRPSDHEQTFVVKVSENRRLTPDDYVRNVFHIDFDISGTGLTYGIGDALGVYGHNDPEQVTEFLEMMQLQKDDIVSRPGQHKGQEEMRTVEQYFTQVLDVFGRPSRRFYSALAEFAVDEKQKKKLELLASPEGGAAFKKRVRAYTTFADLFKEFTSARPPLRALLAMIPDIKPRHYSIASSQNMHPNAVHLLVVLVSWETPAGDTRFGQATRYLANLKEGQGCTVCVKPSVMKLPENPMAPIIMAGLGTGMAPFRAFIEERAYQLSQGIAVGPITLYFGSRYRSKEYLYGDELEAYHHSGLLTHLRCAFSRDGPKKVYIQHLIQEDLNYVYKYLGQDEGTFYLCGPTWPAGDVQDAIESSFTQRGFSETEAKDAIKDLKESERYILEVY